MRTMRLLLENPDSEGLQEHPGPWLYPVAGRVPSEPRLPLWTGEAHAAGLAAELKGPIADRLGGELGGSSLLTGT